MIFSIFHLLRSSMKQLPLLLIFVTFLTAGCADTPENRQLWQGIAAGMHSAGDSMNQGAAEVRRSLQQQQYQQQQQQQYQYQNDVNLYQRLNAQRCMTLPLNAPGC